MTVELMLDQLAEYMAQKDLVMLDKQKLVDSIYTPEIREQVAAIEAEFAGKTAIVDEKIAALEAEIKEAVKVAGASVKGSLLQAVYAKGRVSWDAKGLDGYIVAHPELARFRKEGEPSVSIRKVGK